jgi:hypothetical protein
MTDETKKLFDAPWYVFSAPDDEITVIENESGHVLAELDDVKTANRLAILPELYEELKSSSYDYCWSCLAMLGIDPPTEDELVENLCPRKPSFCGYNNRWKLLRKVKDGK